MGNNPVCYKDPDGRTTHELTDEQWAVVSDTLSNLSNNLDKMIYSLCSGIAGNNMANIDSKIIDSAKTYLGMDISKLSPDSSKLKMLAGVLVLARNEIQSLTRDDFKYNDKADYFAETWPFIFKEIKLGDLFFNAETSAGFDTKEGTIFHEITHHLSVLGTFDYSYEKDTLKKFWSIIKVHNANNWEYFYEEVYNN